MAKIALAGGRRTSSPFPPDLDTGTPGDDRIPGTSSDDFLYIRKTGADTVRAGDGNDFIDVRDQDGGDLFDGGDGQDTLILNYRGSDVAVVLDVSDSGTVQTLADGTRIVRIERLDFKGGAADDSVGGGGADFLDGGGGNDTLSGPAAVMYGGAGDDLIIRADEDFDNLDQMSGGAGRDTIFGSGGEEGIAGDAGADVIDAGDGDDSVNGGAGRDLVDAGAGDDNVFVGAEDGIDRLDGGDGYDYLALDRTGSTIAFVFTFDGPGALTLADGTELVNFETLAFTGGSGDDAVAARGHLDGGLGDDTLSAIGNGRNLVDGGDGDDVLTGGKGPDELHGDVGDDLVTTSDDGDFAYGGDGDDTVIGGDGDDVIDAGRGGDEVSAGAGDDVVYAHDVFGPKDGPDTLDGGDGRDLLSFVTVVEGVTVNLRTGTGPSGGVVLGFEDISGSYDDDHLTGSAEANVIRGGAGVDTLRGGGGADRFVYGAEVHERDFFGEVDDPDRIADFSRAEGDLIDLSRIDAIRGNGRPDAFNFIGSEAFGAAGQLRAVETKPGVFVVSGDRDGDAEADFSIVVRSSGALEASDFLL